jgi:hypothetical protein
MSATFQPLGAGEAGPLRTFLLREASQHLYLLGLLEEFGMGAASGQGTHVFWGRLERGALTAALFVGGGGALVVPSASPTPYVGALATAALAATPSLRLRACLGERGAVDAAVRALSRGAAPSVSRPQRLLVVSADDMGPFTNPRLRLAREEDLPRLVPLAAGDVEERLGHRPLVDDPEGFEARVRMRVRASRTYVLEEGGELVFKVDVGCRSQWGAELEGVYTHPAHRRRKHAILSLGQISRHLLSSLPRLALRLDEGDEAATTLARRVGYVPGPAQRWVLMG